jgi:hypothetical protein
MNAELSRSQKLRPVLLARERLDPGKIKAVQVQ